MMGDEARRCYPHCETHALRFDDAMMLSIACIQCYQHMTDGRVVLVTSLFPLLFQYIILWYVLKNQLYSKQDDSIATFLAGAMVVRKALDKSAFSKHDENLFIMFATSCLLKANLYSFLLYLFVLHTCLYQHVPFFLLTSHNLKLQKRTLWEYGTMCTQTAECMYE